MGTAATLVPHAAAQPLRCSLVPERVGDGAWMIQGADAPIERANGGAIANVALFATDAGAVLVDVEPSLRYGEQRAALARSLTGKPVARVYLTHLQPDHNHGTAAFEPGMIAATPALAAELEREGPGFSDGKYRLLGDWMRGNELHVPGLKIAAEREVVGGREFRLLPLSGHSASDLAVLDTRNGTLVAGDLVCHDRAPSTPHADIPKWRNSPDRLKGLGHARVVPGHGPFDPTPTVAIDQTRDRIDRLDAAMTEGIRGGLDMVDAGAMPTPTADWTSASRALRRSAPIAGSRPRAVTAGPAPPRSALPIARASSASPR